MIDLYKFCVNYKSKNEITNRWRYQYLTKQFIDYTSNVVLLINDNKFKNMNQAKKNTFIKLERHSYIYLRNTFDFSKLSEQVAIVTY